MCQMENGGFLCKPCARHHAASSAAGHHWQNQRASQSLWNSVFSCSHPRVTGTHIVISPLLSKSVEGEYYHLTILSVIKKGSVV